MSTYLRLVRATQQFRKLLFPQMSAVHFQPVNKIFQWFFAAAKTFFLKIWAATYFHDVVDFPWSFYLDIRALFLKLLAHFVCLLQ